VEVEVSREDRVVTNKKKVEGDYVVGYDRANSVVKKGLFRDKFPGFI